MARKLNTLNKGLFNSNNLKKSPERKVGKKESLGKKLGKFALPLMLMGNMVSCDWQNPYMKEFFKDKEQPQKPGYEQPAPEPETPEVEQPTPEQPTPEPEQPTPEQPTPEIPTPEQPEVEQPTPEPEQPTPEPEQPEQPPVEEEPDYCDLCEGTQPATHGHCNDENCVNFGTVYDNFDLEHGKHTSKYPTEEEYPTEQPPVEEEPDYCDRCEGIQGPDHEHDFCDICDGIQYDEFHYQDWHGGEYEEEQPAEKEEPDYCNWCEGIQPETHGHCNDEMCTKFGTYDNYERDHGSEHTMYPSEEENFMEM